MRKKEAQSIFRTADRVDEQIRAEQALILQAQIRIRTLIGAKKALKTLIRVVKAGPIQDDNKQKLASIRKPHSISS